MRAHVLWLQDSLFLETTMTMNIFDCSIILEKYDIII